MKYQDVIEEAPQYGVEVIGDSFFVGDEKRAFMLRYMSGRRWKGVSWDSTGRKIRFEGSRAKVADWCLSEAANGPR